MTIAEGIAQMGLAGKPVSIHASMRSFGQPVHGLLEEFLKADCTVLVPSFTDMYEAPPVPEWMPERNGAGDYSYFFQKGYEDCGAYTPASNAVTVEEMGVFSRMVVENPQRFRGNHAFNSFAAVGKHAEMLVQGQTNEDVYAPLRQLYEMDGWMLLMGVDLRSATEIHFAEQMAGRRPFIRWAKGAAGKTIPVRAGGCSEGFEKLADRLAPMERKVQVGESLWRCWRVRDLVDACVAAIRENPMITHCGDPECSRCNDAVLGGPEI